MKRTRKRIRVAFDAMAATFAVVFTVIVGAVIWLLLAMFLTGCRSTRYVPVETVRTEVQDRVKEVQVADSVVDTRFVYVKGDTVVDWRDRVKWRDRYVHDSVFVERVDSVAVAYPVERELTRWERVKMDFGGVALGGVGVLGVLGLLWLVKVFNWKR